MVETWDAEEDGLSSLPIRVLRPAQWEVDDAKGAVRIWMERSRRETHYTLSVVPILQGIDAGEALPALVRRLVASGTAREPAVRLARSLVHGLAAEGNLEVQLPPLPDVFHGRFERVRELGRGAIGVVWLCRDRARGGASVVVKQAWNWTGALATRNAQVRDEAGVLQRLAHSGIVGFVDAFEEDGLFRLARDFVPGEELAAVVLRDGVGTPEARAARLRRVVDVLAHLHARGVLCLDVNPSNFIVRDGAEVVLADVGHCKVVDARGEVALRGAWGTRRYRAPEIPGVATAASDVYSLGRLVAFLALGRSPPVDADPATLADAVAKAGGTDAEVALVRDACAPDPARRPTLEAVRGLLG